MPRQIKAEMISYLDDKLKENGLAQHSIDVRDARSLLILAAQSCVGIREIGGNNKGPLVELIQKTIGGAYQEAWCMAFVQTMISYVENKLDLKSRLIASEHCLSTWEAGKNSNRVSYFPLPGAIVIWQHGLSQNGHTGIFLEASDGIMTCIEGNTEAGISPVGKVERDGGGVYVTKRSMKGTGLMRVKGFLKPF
jgi:hypothetical protein